MSFKFAFNSKINITHESIHNRFENIVYKTEVLHYKHFIYAHHYYNDNHLDSSAAMTLSIEC
jgi:hypothetical protein